MLPEGIDEHSPQLLLKLLAHPPGNHGEYLRGEAAEAYRFLIEHRYLTQTESKSRRNSGRRAIITTTLDHKAEKSAEQLRHYLTERIEQL